MPSLKSRIFRDKVAIPSAIQTNRCWWGGKELTNQSPAYQDDLEEAPDGPRKDGQKGKIQYVTNLDTHSPAPPPNG